MGLMMLLDGKDQFPGEWTSKNRKGPRKEPRERTWEVDPVLVRRAMVADLYQDTMRICIRRDPRARAHIFVPTSEPAIVVRLLRFLRGVTVAHHGQDMPG